MWIPVWVAGAQNQAMVEQCAGCKRRWDHRDAKVSQEWNKTFTWFYSQAAVIKLHICWFHCYYSDSRNNFYILEAMSRFYEIQSLIGPLGYYQKVMFNVVLFNPIQSAVLMLKSLKSFALFLWPETTNHI